MPNDKTGEINVNVLVVGCGRLGRRLAEMLDQNRDDVAVIDSDPLNFCSSAMRSAALRSPGCRWT
ncbi:MAG: NAD-binding protein [Hydrogeniiclostridium mannosilyticum]